MVDTTLRSKQKLLKIPITQISFEPTNNTIYKQITYVLKTYTRTTTNSFSSPYLFFPSFFSVAKLTLFFSSTFDRSFSIFSWYSTVKTFSYLTAHNWKEKNDSQRLAQFQCDNCLHRCQKIRTQIVL